MGGDFMEKEIMKIIIQDEKSKEEVIYNHILSSLSKEEQIRYLKSKVLYLEAELKNRMQFIFLFLFSFVLLCLGILFLSFDLYVLGIFFIFAVFATLIWKFVFVFRSFRKNILDDEFYKLEDLKKSLLQKLK